MEQQESKVQPQPLNYQNYSFKLQDFQSWNPFLKQHGFVVIQSIVTTQQVQSTTDMFWEWLQKLGSGIKRSDPTTWLNKNWPGLDDMGFLVSYGGCHTKASWFLRCHPRVQQAFKYLWACQQLITSFDTFISWKPWWLPFLKQKGQNWTPYVQNLHLDQNPYQKQGLKCIQGMIPLKRVRKDEVGGLMVIPKSNTDEMQRSIVKDYPGIKFSGDWLEMKENDQRCKNGFLVECEAGDLILWDSRTIHGGSVGQPSEKFKKNNTNELVRLSLTVTMVPREWASPEVIQKRRMAFEKKIGLTHWPHEYNVNGMGKMAPGIKRQNIEYQWCTKDENIEKLI